MCFGGCPADHRRTARVLGALGHILANRELRWRTFANMIPRRTASCRDGRRGARCIKSDQSRAEKRKREREKAKKVAQMV